MSDMTDIKIAQIKAKETAIQKAADEKSAAERQARKQEEERINRAQNFWATTTCTRIRIVGDSLRAKLAGSGLILSFSMEQGRSAREGFGRHTFTLSRQNTQIGSLSITANYDETVSCIVRVGTETAGRQQNKYQTSQLVDDLIAKVILDFIVTAQDATGLPPRP